MVSSGGWDVGGADVVEVVVEETGVHSLWRTGNVPRVVVCVVVVLGRSRLPVVVWMVRFGRGL